MSLAPGARLGPYEIAGPLGTGGMGEVYRARDTRLGRDVAIKVLPEAFTQDAERLARFQREAQVLAQLHHPHIASIFGLEESAGVRALVMELVEGPTLADRLESGPIPPDECLSIARQIAEALEDAHDKGIVHRDLKPQNVKAPPGGKVKVLDFGLAKAMDPAAAGPGSDPSRAPTLMNSPTMTSVQGTQMGVILGTAAYMAPEQARGGAIDRRADIWSFGVVLYEMLCGVSLFGADTVGDTLAGVLKTEIDHSKLPRSTPPAVRRLLRRCLERNPKNRLRDIGDARIVLEELARGGADEPSGASPAPAGSALRRAAPWAVAALAVAVAIGALAWRGGVPPSAARPLTTFGVRVPEEHFLPQSQTPLLDLSADGRTLLFVAEGRETMGVFRRTLDRLAATRIAGTDGAEEPRLSPDGRWIAFFAGGALRKVPAEGGSAVTVADARAPRGLAWAPDGTLVFSPVYNSGLWRVPATGGTPAELTKLDAARGERTHRWPQVLPDGRTAIFTVQLASKPGDYDDAKIDAVRLDTGERRTILEGARMARYGGGYLVYQRQQALLAVRFDPGALKTLGTPVAIQEGVGGEASSGAGHFAVSGTGLLALVPQSSIPTERVLALVDRQGRETELAAPPAAYNAPRFSPDGRTIAVSIGTGSGADDDVYLVDLATQRLRRLTFGQGHGHPIWTPDGRWIIYTKGRSGDVGLGKRAVDGSGGETLFASELGMSLADSWNPDGKRLAVTDVRGSLDIRILEDEGRKISLLFASPAVTKYSPSFSPDGRFIAYASTEAGTDEVFVETFPPGGGKWQVSSSLGTSPVWSRDGRELYLVVGATITAIDTEIHGVFRAGPPKPLFSGPYDIRVPPLRNFDVGPDGRFVMVKRKYLSSSPREIVLVDGWSSLDPAGKPGT